MIEDKINPSYYSIGKCSDCDKPLQAYDYLKNLPYSEASAIKYITRHRNKGKADDIKKSIWFLRAILKDTYGEDYNG